MPKVQEMAKRDITDRLGAQGADRICAVRQGFTGIISTEAVLMFPVEQSLQLVPLMAGDDVVRHVGRRPRDIVARYGAEDSAATLLRQADMALYAAKNAGRNRVVQCDPEIYTVQAD